MEVGEEGGIWGGGRGYWGKKGGWGEGGRERDNEEVKGRW
jgi:hypothetical protein